MAECGYDAGDCGTEKWEKLLSYQVNGHQFEKLLAYTVLKDRPLLVSYLATPLTCISNLEVHGNE